MPLLSFALRSFASTFFRFTCWAATTFAAGCLSVVAMVEEGARGLAAPMIVAVSVVSRAVVVLAFGSRDFVAVLVCFACSCAAGLAAAGFLAAVDDVADARGLVVSMTVLGEVALRVVRVRVRSPCDCAAMLASLAACGVAAAAACVVGIVVDDEFSSTFDGEGGVGKLSFVGFFWCPG